MYPVHKWTETGPEIAFYYFFKFKRHFLNLTFQYISYWIKISTRTYSGVLNTHWKETINSIKENYRPESILKLIFILYEMCLSEQVTTYTDLF